MANLLYGSTKRDKQPSGITINKDKKHYYAVYAYNSWEFGFYSLKGIFDNKEKAISFCKEIGRTHVFDFTMVYEGIINKKQSLAEDSYCYLYSEGD